MIILHHFRHFGSKTVFLWLPARVQRSLWWCNPFSYNNLCCPFVPTVCFAERWANHSWITKADNSVEINVGAASARWLHSKKRCNCLTFVPLCTAWFCAPRGVMNMNLESCSEIYTFYFLLHFFIHRNQINATALTAYLNVLLAC